ncbi:MAG: hypothetical protein ACI4L5_03105 [Negativibacillus sp.]
MRKNYKKKKAPGHQTECFLEEMGKQDVYRNGIKFPKKTIPLNFIFVKPEKNNGQKQKSTGNGNKFLENVQDDFICPSLAHFL